MDFGKVVSELSAMGYKRAAARAKMDMDVDFVRRSISTEAIEAFVAKLDAASDCSIAVDGKIVELRQQEYRGKRVFLRITDGHGYTVLSPADTKTSMTCTT